MACNILKWQTVLASPNCQHWLRMCYSDQLQGPFKEEDVLSCLTWECRNYGFSKLACILVVLHFRAVALNAIHLIPTNLYGRDNLILSWATSYHRWSPNFMRLRWLAHHRCNASTGARSGIIYVEDCAMPSAGNWKWCAYHSTLVSGTGSASRNWPKRSRWRLVTPGKLIGYI